MCSHSERSGAKSKNRGMKTKGYAPGPLDFARDDVLVSSCHGFFQFFSQAWLLIPERGLA